MAVGVCGNNALRGQQEEEEEGQVGCRMADELDEGLSDEESDAAFRRHQVADGEEGEEEADEDARDELARPVAPPPAWELIVPS